MLYTYGRETLLLAFFFTVLSACQGAPPTAEVPDDASVLAAYGVSSEQTSESGQHFTPYAIRTGNNATLILPASAPLQVGGTTLAPGDEIAVFTADGLCAGSMVWQGKSAALTLWGDNAMTEAKDGLAPDEPLTFRVWDASEGVEYRQVSVDLASGRPYLQTQPRYYPEGIYVVEALKATSGR